VTCSSNSGVSYSGSDSYDKATLTIHR
jgi:hypothetical protein